MEDIDVKRFARIGAALKRASKRKKATRVLEDLPPEIQKDIGWPETIEFRTKSGCRFKAQVRATARLRPARGAIAADEFPREPLLAGFHPPKRALPVFC